MACGATPPHKTPTQSHHRSTRPRKPAPVRMQNTVSQRATLHTSPNVILMSLERDCRKRPISEARRRFAPRPEYRNETTDECCGECSTSCEVARGSQKPRLGPISAKTGRSSPRVGRIPRTFAKFGQCYPKSAEVGKMLANIMQVWWSLGRISAPRASAQQLFGNFGACRVRRG